MTYQNINFYNFELQSLICVVTKSVTLKTWFKGVLEMFLTRD